MPPKEKKDDKTKKGADDVAIQVRSAELLYKVSCRQRGCGPFPELQKQLQQCAEESKHLVKVVLKGPSVDDASLQSVLDLLAGYNPVRALHCWGTSISDQGLAALANHLRCSSDRWWRGSKLLIIELSNTCKLTPPDPSQPQQACTPYPLHTGASSRSSNPLPQLTAPHAPVLPTPRSPFSPEALQQLALALGTAGLALTTLRLDHTPIADAGAAALCEGLQRCSGLKELSMAYCSMGPQGVRHVATALLRRFKPEAAEEEAPAEPAPARPAPAAVAKPAGGGPGSRPSSGRPSRLSMAQPAVPPAEPHTELAPLAEEEGQAEQDGAAAGAAAEPGAAGAAAEPAAAESSVGSGAAASAAGLPNALGGLAAVAMAAAAAARAQRVVKPGELLRLCLSGNMCGAACLHHVAALLRGAPCLQVLQLADVGLQEHEYWALQNLAAAVAGSGLQQLDLDMNFIGDRCASLLLPALQQCSSLVLLKVSSRLGRQAMAALLAAMEANAAAGRKKGGKKGGGKNKK